MVSRGRDAEAATGQQIRRQCKHVGSALAGSVAAPPVQQAVSCLQREGSQPGMNVLEIFWPLLGSEHLCGRTSHLPAGHG